MKDKRVKQYEQYFIEKHGYVFCEHTGRSDDAPYSTHHIMFKSEFPKHPELHNPLNLIMLGYTAHTEAHKHKEEWRKQYVEERGLRELFK